MKFICSTNALLKQLQVLFGVMGTRSVVPILEYFLFEIEDSKLVITGTDLEVSMRSSLPVESTEEGKIAVPARYIIDILKILPEQPVTFTINPETKSIELTSENGKYKISGENPEDFPKFPVVEGGSSTSLSAPVLAAAISTTSFATGTDELRPAMTGLFFQMSPDDLKFVATDGNKLVLYKRADAKADQEDAFILPKKALNLLKNSLPDTDTTVKLSYNKLNAHFEIGNLHLVCRLIDERFPDFRTAIPQDADNQLRVNRTAILNSLRRTVIFSSKSTHMVRFTIAGNELTINAQDVDFANEAVERLDCSYEGEDMEIGFNARFLIDMLSILDSEEVDFSLTAYNRPGVLRPSETLEGEEILMLLMPIVLSY